MDHFRVGLYQQILDAISDGKTNFVFWGFNSDTVWLLSQLHGDGLLESHVSGVVDTSASQQGKRVFSFEIVPPSKVSDLEIDVLVITLNTEKEKHLRIFAEYDRRVPQVILSGVGHLAFDDPAFHQILSSCLVKSYATGYPNSLIHMYQSIKYLSERGIKGDVAEFGIFKGGTIVFLSKVLQHFGYNDVKVYGFDIFEGFPPSRTVFDLYSNPKCEFTDYQAVAEYCERYGVQVVKGDICDTYKILQGSSLMFTFFDTDNYSPVRAALEMCFTQTVQGGVIAFDHYTTIEPFVYTIGERMAAEEVLAGKQFFHLHDTGIFVKL